MVNDVKIDINDPKYEWAWDEVNAEDDCDDNSMPEEFEEECEVEGDWINYGNDLVVNPEYREWMRERKARVRAKIIEAVTCLTP